MWVSLHAELFVSLLAPLHAELIMCGSVNVVSCVIMCGSVNIPSCLTMCESHYVMNFLIVCGSLKACVLELFVYGPSYRRVWVALLADIFAGARSLTFCFLLLSWQRNGSPYSDF